MKLTSIRVTELDLYENCPYCFYLQKTGIKRVPNENLRIGTLTHKAIEEYHRFNKQVFAPEIAKIVKPYVQSRKTTAFREIEWKFTLPDFLQTGIALTGTLDLISNDDWIHEHKTSASRWSQKKADEHKQITAYAYAYRQVFGKEERGIRFNILVKNKTPLIQTLDTWRDENDFTVWKSWVLGILEKIKKDQFEPNYAAFYHNFTICQGSLRV